MVLATLNSSFEINELLDICLVVFIGIKMLAQYFSKCSNTSFLISASLVLEFLLSIYLLEEWCLLGP